MELMLPFTDKSDSFVNGVEFGRILAALERNETTIFNQGFPVHKANQEVIKNACSHYGYTSIFGAQYHEWIDFVAFKIITDKN